MLAILPNCFRLSLSEVDQTGVQDYIIDQGDIEMPTAADLLRLATPEITNKNLRLRQLSFHSALLKLAESQQQNSSAASLVIFEIPTKTIESIASLQKKQKAKLVRLV